VKARVDLGGVARYVELDAPIELAIPIAFDGSVPRFFGAPQPRSQPFTVGSFHGEVARGASCNCRTIQLTPHCNGTHTESAGHLTIEPLDAWRIAPRGLVASQVVSIFPEPDGDDRIVTAAALERAWPEQGASAEALIVRTLPNDSGKRTRDWTAGVAPYFSLDAIERLVARGVHHLVVDLPSIDRAHDQGRLANHRAFFGLPAASTALGDVSRPTATITELAFVPDAAVDGPYALALQVPALAGDAVPSRPLLYRWEPA
jgi:kynurenine formamidase